VSLRFAALATPPFKPVDNLCHTLAGAALAKAGLDRRTPLATPALLIAANLPDLDILSYLRDPLFALTFRRGWTHGVLAMLALPPLLAGVMLLWDRQVRRRLQPDAPPAIPRQLMLVSVAGVLSHPLLDLLNTYGVRLLMPFSERWFYGDTLFIIDPWLWLLLGIVTVLGTVGGRRERARADGNAARRAARLVLAGAVIYIAGMYVAGQAARTLASKESGIHGLSPERVMAAPVPLTPFRRAVLLDLGDEYRWGALDWRAPAPRLAIDTEAIRTNLRDPVVVTALEEPEARAFLRWSRFPAAVVVPGRGVRLYDLRYGDADTDSWASVLIADRSSSPRTSSISGSPR
jgi:inner membrane protein